MRHVAWNRWQATRRMAMALTGAWLVGLAGGVQAQTPASTLSGPVKTLVGFPAGGGSDAIARILAESMQKTLGVPVVVENKAGAGGQIAAQTLKAAPADGTTLFLSHDHSISILPLVVKNAGFDPAKDFTPVAGIATFVNALALSGGTPAKGYKNYMASVKAQGGAGNVGIPAPASTLEFLVKVLAKQNQLDLAPVPYRGSAPMMGDMLGNQIPAGAGSVPDFIENHRAGKIKVVAVMGTERQPVMPDVPTFAELGVKGFEDLPYYGLFAPAGTPAEALKPLADAVNQALQQPVVRGRLTTMGLNVEFMTGKQLAQRERAYSRTWARIIKDSGFVPQ